MSNEHSSSYRPVSEVPIVAGDCLVGLVGDAGGRVKRNWLTGEWFGGMKIELWIHVEKNLLRDRVSESIRVLDGQGH